MEHLTRLNSRDKKEIYKVLESQFGIVEKIDLLIFKSRKNKLYAINSAFETVDVSQLRVDTFGLYIGEIDKDLRLSLEGSYLLGKYATKNVLELSKGQATLWMSGFDLEYDGELTGWILLKFQDDWMGSGYVKEGKILNYIPKARRIKID